MPVARGHVVRMPSTPEREKESLDSGTAAEDLADQLLRHLTNGLTGNEENVLLDREAEGLRLVVVRSVAQGVTSGPGTPVTPHRNETHALSPRELEIVLLVAEGHPTKAIALVLDISPWTVNAHLRRVFEKVGVASRAAMISKLSGGVAD